MSKTCVHVAAGAALPLLPALMPPLPPMPAAPMPAAPLPESSSSPLPHATASSAHSTAQLDFAITLLRVDIAMFLLGFARERTVLHRRQRVQIRRDVREVVVHHSADVIGAARMRTAELLV